MKRRFRARWLPRLLCLGWACAAAAQVDPGPALQIVPDGARVLHCALEGGVLRLRYVQDGQTASAAAFHTGAIYQACARAGYPLPDGPQRRGAGPPPVQRIAIAPPLPRPGASGGLGVAVEPTYSVTSGGGALTIDGRNHGDTPYYCTIDFAWAADGEPGGSRAVTASASLPPRQSNRVLSLPAPPGGARIIGLPRWNCRPG